MYFRVSPRALSTNAAPDILETRIFYGHVILPSLLRVYSNLVVPVATDPTTFHRGYHFCWKINVANIFAVEYGCFDLFRFG